MMIPSAPALPLNAGRAIAIRVFRLSRRLKRGKLLSIFTRWILILPLVFLPAALCLPGISAAAGDLDPSFGSGGKTTTTFFNQGDFGEAVATQPDGKLIAAGGAGLVDGNDDLPLAPYNTDGSPAQ